MDEIIDKLNYIIDTRIFLDDLALKQFDDSTAEKINIIHELVNDLIQNVNSQEISSQNQEKMAMHNKKQKIIKQMIFSHYWLINETINSITNESDLDKIIDHHKITN